MNILLINPNWGGRVSKKGSRYNRAFPPLDLLQIGAILREKQHVPTLYDANVHFDKDVLDDLIGKNDYIILTSTPYYKWQCPNLNYEDFINFSGYFPKDKTILYGSHVTQYPDIMTDKTGFKYAVIGEPENAVIELLELLQSGKINKGKIIYKSDNQVDINSFPLPAFDLIENINHYGYEILGNKLMMFEGSRGCPFPCIYCYKDMFGKKIRKKSADRLFNEVFTAFNLGYKNAYIYDLEFTIHRELVIEFCRKIINSKIKLKWTCQGRADSVDKEMLYYMKKSGCKLMHFGVESGNDRILEVIKKKTTKEKLLKGFRLTQKAGIETAGFFMFGFPRESDKEREETIDFAVKLNPDYASFHVASIYPGTEFFQINVDNGGNRDVLYPECMDTLYNKYDLQKFVKKAFIKFYIRPAYIFKRLFTASPISWFKQFKLFLSFLRS